jgi:hypothetical protein
MQVKDLLNPNFLAAFNVLTTKELPVRTSKKIAELTKEINKKLKDYEDRRQALLKEYAILKVKPDSPHPAEGEEQEKVLDLDDKGNAKFEDGKLELFTKEVEAAQNLHVLLPSISVFELGEECKISANVIDALGALIKS